MSSFKLSSYNPFSTTKVTPASEKIVSEAAKAKTQAPPPTQGSGRESHHYSSKAGNFMRKQLEGMHKAIHRPQVPYEKLDLENSNLTKELEDKVTVLTGRKQEDYQRILRHSVELKPKKRNEQLKALNQQVTAAVWRVRYDEVHTNIRLMPKEQRNALQEKYDNILDGADYKTKTTDERIAVLVGFNQDIRAKLEVINEGKKGEIRDLRRSIISQMESMPEGQEFDSDFKNARTLLSRLKGGLDVGAYQQLDKDLKAGMFAPGSKFSQQIEEDINATKTALLNHLRSMPAGHMRDNLGQMCSDLIDKHKGERTIKAREAFDKVLSLVKDGVFTPVRTSERALPSWASATEKAQEHHYLNVINSYSTYDNEVDPRDQEEAARLLGELRGRY